MAKSAPPTSSQPAIHSYLGLALGVLAVSTAAPLIKLIQNAAVPSLVIAAYRLALAALILTPIAVIRCRAEFARLTRRDFQRAALTGLCLGLHFAAWITSLEFTSIASSVVLVTTTPLFVGVFSMLVWREKLGRSLLLGLGVAVLGGVIVGLADVCALRREGIDCPPLAVFFQGEAIIGDLLALAGAIAMTGYLLIGQRLRAKLSLLAYIFLSYSVAAMTLVVAALMSGESFFGYPPVAYFWIALLALAPQLIGHSAFNWALRYLSAIYVSVTILGEPVGSTILAWLILGQAPKPLVAAGGALILGGILLASKR